MRRGQPYVHDEIARVLRAKGGGAMKADAIASAINRAGRYEKNDGSAMTANQVHARVSKKPGMFERTPTGIRLR